MRRLPRQFVIALCVGTFLAGEGDGFGAIPTVDSDSTVFFKTIEPDATSGRLIAFSLADGAILRDAKGKIRRIAAADLVRLTTETTEHGRAGGDTVFTLTNGDVINGTIQAGDADAVSVETAAFGRISIPLDVIARMDMPAAFSPAYRESLPWFDRQVLTNSDHILLTNGDVVRGFVTVLASDGITIDGELGEMLIASRLVVALRLATPVDSPENPRYAVLRLRSTGRVTAGQLSWKDDRVNAKLHFGASVSFDAKLIVRMDLVGGKWEWLARHRPISYEHTPMLALYWDFVPDRNVLGKTLTVNGEAYEHGVGVHSRSSLTYDLKGLYREFVTSFGIDDDSGPMADVAVAILVDGKRRFSQTNVRRGELFGPVRLDVTRANRIELIVDFGENGDLQDRFDWIEAALVR